MPNPKNEVKTEIKPVIAWGIYESGKLTHVEIDNYIPDPKSKRDWKAIEIRPIASPSDEELWEWLFQNGGMIWKTVGKKWLYKKDDIELLGKTPREAVLAAYNKMKGEK